MEWAKGGTRTKGKGIRKNWKRGGKGTVWAMEELSERGECCSNGKNGEIAG